MDRQQMELELGEGGQEEEETYFGKVTAVTPEELVVDERLVLGRHSVGRMDGRVAEKGDSVCLGLVRRERGEWRVKELLQVSGEDWGGEGAGSRDCGEVREGGPRTQVCGVVQEVSGGRISVVLPGGTCLSFPTSLWREASQPRPGDLASLRLQLVSRDLEELEQGKVESGGAVRSLETDATVDFWQGGRGTAR